MHVESMLKRYHDFFHLQEMKLKLQEQMHFVAHSV